jgi:predicted MFS family arabinose efflux permease
MTPLPLAARQLTRPSATAIRLFVLAAATFTFVTTETQPVALLSPMAHGLSVSESTVGLLMTAYAGVAALTAIPLTALASRVLRRRLMILTVGMLVLSQLGLALAPDYAVALGARLFGALAHGVFWSVVAQVAASLVPRDRLGRATAAAFAGNSVALVIGAPLVSVLGAIAGWREAVGVIGALALLVVIGMVRVLPEIDAPAPDPDRRALVSSALRHRGVMIVCAVTVLLAFGQFVAFTYLSPIVREHTGLTGTGLSAVLLAYGVAGVVAFARLGALADRRPRAALLSCCALIVTALVVIVVIAHGTVPLILATLAWGAGFTALPVFLQSAVLRVAPEIPDTASSVFVVAFQIGIGGGALVGSGLLGSGHVTAIPQLALVLFVAGSMVAVAARRTFGGDDAAPTQLRTAHPARPITGGGSSARWDPLHTHPVRRPRAHKRPRSPRSRRRTETGQKPR